MRYYKSFLLMSVLVIHLFLRLQISDARTQTVADCVAAVADTSKAKICNIRQTYRVTRDGDVARYLKCALGVIGFVATDGTVQRNEVLAALDEVETHDGVYTDSVDACLSRSKKTIDADERPHAFFSCMLQTESAQNFKDALELRELKTASEWPEGGAFDKSKVQQLMKEVNRKLSC